MIYIEDGAGRCVDKGIREMVMKKKTKYSSNSPSADLIYPSPFNATLSFALFETGK